jgi:hypothetical protein
MLATAEAGVHLPAGEWHGQEALSLLHALERSLEFPARIRVVQRCGRAGAQNLLEDPGHGVEIIHGLEVHGLVLPGKVARRSAAILGRTVAVTIKAERTRSSCFELNLLLDPDFMPPGDVEVVLVRKAASGPQAEARQVNVRRARRELGRAIPHADGTGTDGCPPSPSRPGGSRAARASSSRQAQVSRLGRHLPRPTPHPERFSSCAIALAIPANPIVNGRLLPAG